MSYINEGCFYFPSDWLTIQGILLLLMNKIVLMYNKTIDLFMLQNWQSPNKNCKSSGLNFILEKWGLTFFAKSFS